MQTVFEVIAESNRRAILSQLAGSEKSVQDLEAALHLPQPKVSKHLKVLKEFGLVESRVSAQKRIYRIKFGPLKEADQWLQQFRQLWEPHMDALEKHLDRLHGEKPSNP